MAWAGTGVVFVVTGCGVSTSRLGARAAASATGSFSFVQISDSHIGFDKAANRNVIGTLRAEHRQDQRPAASGVRDPHRRPCPPFHTRGVGQPFKQLLGAIKTGQVFNVPGEHDVFGARSGPPLPSVLRQGVDRHRVLQLRRRRRSLPRAVKRAGVQGRRQAANNGLGILGAEQLAWIKKDLAARSSDTPIVILGHVPLLAVYPQWGWATEDTSRSSPGCGGSAQ